jgi:hypothetical protein
VVAAAEAAALCVRRDAEVLGLWLADTVLARRLRWPCRSSPAWCCSRGSDRP